MAQKKKIKKVKRPVKKAAKKPAAKKTTPAKAAGPKPPAPAAPKPATPAAPAKIEVVEGTLLGTVEDYFTHVGVIALTLQDSLAAGDTIRIKGHTTDLIEKVGSIQIEHQSVTSAKAGDGIGIKVKDRCRPGDRVYRI